MFISHLGFKTPESHLLHLWPVPNSFASLQQFFRPLHNLCLGSWAYSSATSLVTQRLTIKLPTCTHPALQNHCQTNSYTYSRGSASVLHCCSSAQTSPPISAPLAWGGSILHDTTLVPMSCMSPLPQPAGLTAWLRSPQRAVWSQVAPVSLLPKTPRWHSCLG